MRLSAEQFLERPPKSLGTLYVIHGAEPLAALETADALRDRARLAGYTEREVFTAESAGTVLDSVGKRLYRLPNINRQVYNV